MDRRKFIMTASAAITFPIAGCSGKSSGVLRGIVTYNGANLAMGSVGCYGEDNTPRGCEIQPDGSYRIEDLPGGVYKLCVNSPNPAAAKTAAMPVDDIRGEINRSSKKNPATMTAADQPPPANADPAKWVQIPERYNSPDTSSLVATVDGETEYNIAMLTH
jgi:hypothetical protein